MLLYFEFEGKRRKADVSWSKNSHDILIQVNDKELIAELPTDLNYELREGNKVSYILEDPANKRLIELQQVLGRRIQELVNR